MEKKLQLSDVDLGLTAAADSIQKAEKALDEATAAVALEATAAATKKAKQATAEKRYMIEKKRAFLNRCKADERVEFIGQEAYEPILGKVYTFAYNTIPVTVRFDGSKQVLPKFIYDFLQEKLNNIGKSNKPQEAEIEELGQY